jgi:hypothetical protein
VDLADDAHGNSLLRSGKRGPLSREARPDHQDIVVRHESDPIAERFSGVPRARVRGYFFVTK